MMHHNLNVSIERSGTSYVGHIELSTSGTANRANVTAESYEGIQAALKEKHDEFLKAAQDFHGEPAHHNITHPSEGLMRTVAPAAPKAKDGKKAKTPKAAKPKKEGAAPKAKDKPRSFASE